MLSPRLDGFGLSRSAPMCPASLWVLPRRSSRLCCSSRSTLATSSHSGPLESRSRFAWLCRERSCARQSLEKSALFRRLRRSMCSRHGGTINKKTRLSGADAVKHTAPPLYVWRQGHALESVAQTHGSSAQSPWSLWANIGAPAHGFESVFERKYGCRYACNSHEVRVRPRAL